MHSETFGKLRTVFGAALLLAAVGLAQAAANITIVNGNAAGLGFNDPTPAVPVGGNPGTTLGQQRINAFQYVASIWGANLGSSVEIKVLATFEPLTCSAGSAVLGSAGPPLRRVGLSRCAGGRCLVPLGPGQQACRC